MFRMSFFNKDFTDIEIFLLEFLKKIFIKFIKTFFHNRYKLYLKIIINFMFNNLLFNFKLLINNLKLFMFWFNNINTLFNIINYKLFLF
jgi:hypothetical protein